MVTPEEIGQLRQLYAACKDESMLRAKIPCSQEQYIIVKRILDSENEENWFERLSKSRVKNALALRKDILETEKGEILLRLAAQAINDIVTDDLKRGILLLRRLATEAPSNISLAIFVEAKELFEKDFALRHDMMLRIYSITIDKIKPALTDASGMSKQILWNLGEKRKELFSGKKEEKIDLVVIRDFLRAYDFLNSLLSSFEQSMMHENKSFIVTTEKEELSWLGQEEVAPEPREAPRRPAFFQGRRGAIIPEKEQMAFNLTLD